MAVGNANELLFLRLFKNMCPHIKQFLCLCAQDFMWCFATKMVFSFKASIRPNYAKKNIFLFSSFLRNLLKTHKQHMSHLNQMIKMRPLSGLLAFFLFFCFVHSCTGDTGHETVVVFKAKETDVSYKNESSTTVVHKPSVFRLPAFVGGVLKKNMEFLAIISGANVFPSSRATPIDGVVRTSFGNHTVWSAAELFTNDTKTTVPRSLWGSFTAVMKENKIYVLAKSHYRPGTDPSKDNSYKGWKPFLFVGTVNDLTTSDVSGVSVTWEAGKPLWDTLPKDAQGKEVTHVVGGVGNGVVTKKGAIVFPILVNDALRKPISSIVYSTDNGSTWKMGGMAEKGTYDSSVVELEDGKLLLIAPSDKGYRRVFESGNMGTTWNESLVLSKVWGNKPSRKDYGKQGSAIKVPVDGKDVLLFAHPLSEKGDHYPDTLQLWLSDGQRIVFVGTISEEKEQHTGNSILAHVGSHLYVTHEINPQGVRGSSAAQLKEWDGVIGLTHLPNFLQSATTTVRAWHKLDTKYKTKGVPTDGLVGFLVSAKSDNSAWEDMYRCMNAKVIGGERVDGGFHFDGAAGSGAQWPVGSQGQNQVYAFANKQFTLAATVTIDAGKATGKFPLLGASLSPQENNALIGLGYTEDNKWYAVNHNNKEIATTHAMESGKEYHVALTLANGVAAVYVDGEEIAKGQITIPSEFSISHFFMGGAGVSSSGATGNSCTVKNVMLFNRALGTEEMKKLSKVSKDANLHTPIPTPKTTSKPETPDTTAAMKLKTLLEDNKLVLTTKPQQTLLYNKQEAVNEIAKNKGVDSAVRNFPDGALGTHIKRADTAAVPFRIMPFMCLVCSVIVLAGF